MPPPRKDNRIARVLRLNIYKFCKKCYSSDIIHHFIGRFNFKKAAFTLAERGAQAAQSHNIRRPAFTLAEVLITLGIIGVVAALTIPSLVNNYKKQEYSAKIKKFYSTMSQAIERSEVDNGPALYWSKDAQLYTDDGKVDWDGNANLNAVFMKKYILPYLKYLNEGTEAGMQNYNYYTINLSDGSTFSVHNGDCLDIMYDINGLRKPPNSDGQDTFRFLMCFTDITRINYFKDKNKFFGTYSYYNDTSREEMKNKCKTTPSY